MGSKLGKTYRKFIQLRKVEVSNEKGYSDAVCTQYDCNSLNGNTGQ